MRLHGKRGDCMAVNERLKQLRKGHRLTLEQLAKALGLTKQSIPNYERGVRTPDTKTVEAHADCFNVGVDYVLGRSERTTFIATPEEIDLVKRIRRLNAYQRRLITLIIEEPPEMAFGGPKKENKSMENRNEEGESHRR